MDESGFVTLLFLMISHTRYPRDQPSDSELLRQLVSFSLELMLKLGSEKGLEEQNRSETQTV